MSTTYTMMVVDRPEGSLPGLLAAQIAIAAIGALAILISTGRFGRTGRAMA